MQYEKLLEREKRIITEIKGKGRYLRKKMSEVSVTSKSPGCLGKNNDSGDLQKVVNWRALAEQKWRMFITFSKLKRTSLRRM